MLCAVGGVMKAGICRTYIPLAVAKVAALYHFYGMIILGRQHLTKREFDPTTPKMKDYRGSRSLPPQTSNSTLFPHHVRYLLSHYSHLIISLSLFFDSARLVHWYISPTSLHAIFKSLETNNRHESVKWYSTKIFKHLLCSWILRCLLVILLLLSTLKEQ